MGASRFDCCVAGIVMVKAVAKMNSVTTSVGIKLATFLSSSLHRAPSSDCYIAT
jgi:hypothetical protein